MDNSELEAIARKAVNALIEDAKADFKGERREAFAFAVYNAIRHTDAEQVQNLRELLHKYGLDVGPKGEDKPSWIN